MKPHCIIRPEPGSIEEAELLAMEAEPEPSMNNQSRETCTCDAIVPTAPGVTRERHYIACPLYWTPQSEVSKKAERERVAFRLLCDTICESVEATEKLGMPSGHLYAQLMTLGMSLETYEGIMNGLVKIGKLRKSGDCYHAR